MESTSVLPSASSTSITASSSRCSSSGSKVNTSELQPPPKKYIQHDNVQLISQLSTPYDQTTFRNMSINSIAVVPLLSHTNNNTATGSSVDNNTASTHSTKSYYEFMNALRRHPYCAGSTGSTTSGSPTSTHTHSHTDNDITLLNVPNNSLTRPSDWKYDTTPFHTFHWSYGCQRIVFHDGRPATDSVSTLHQQQLYYHYTASPSYRNYIDLYPYRRTAAIIGILNIQDCIPIKPNTDTDTDNKNAKEDEGEDRTTLIKQMIQRACEELQQWSYRYSTPTYGASTYGHTTTSTSTSTTIDHDRDIPITRLFVYDSFNIDTPIIDLLQQQTILLKDSNSIIAFPPTTKEHEMAMTLHYNLILSDLMVSIFRNLEQKVLYSNHLITTMSNNDNTSSNDNNTSTTTTASTTGLARRSLARFVTSSSSAEIVEQLSTTTSTSKVTLGINQLINYVDPESSLVKKASLSTSSSVTSTGDTTTTTSSSSPAIPTATSQTTTTALSSSSTSTSSVKSTTISKLLQLLTPMDDELMTNIIESNSSSTSMMSYKEIELFKKREIGRREKYIGDLCLLAGTPLDAYEHYIKAMELLSYKGNSSSTSGNSSILDPLWYTATLEACAVAHIVMAEIGGYGVDDYLENNFQLPEEIMALARDDTSTTSKTKASSATYKQTLPEVVFALCDEALHLLSRHVKLGTLYAELMLKLAIYTADEAESHLRCRWGEGLYCYPGDEGDQVKRWDRTSVSKLNFLPLRTKDGYSMITINTHNRIKKLSALLSAAVSIGSLDPPTRVDVAIRCARICLYGVKPTHWKGALPARIPLPRKAAYFTVVAADAMTETQPEIGKFSSAQTLWLLANQLYTCKSNPIDGGGDYGWATLRAFCLSGLSTQGCTELSLEAADQLLSLLGELVPEVNNLDDKSDRDKHGIESEGKSEEDQPLPIDSESNKETTVTTTKDVPRAAISLEDSDLQEAITTANQFAKNLRVTYNNLTVASPLLAQQSKWANDKAIPSVQVPLSETSSISPFVVSLRAVWPHMSSNITTLAQNHCLNRAASLRRAIPTSSANIDVSHSYGFSEKDLPLYIASDVLVQTDPLNELECVKRRLPSDVSKSKGLETFYNPFAKKASEGGPVARVAEDEERIVSVTFGNRLSVPLQVQRSQLEFDDNTTIKASTLSFVIPPKSMSFVVNYPFRVVRSSNYQRDKEIEDCSPFEIRGVNLVCIGCQISLPIKVTKNGSSKIPESVRLHPTSTQNIKTIDSTNTNLRIESYPSQPRLEVVYTETNKPIPDVVPMTLSNGEICTLPSFSLRNDAGKNSKIECLEIILVGTPNRKLYDSSSEQLPEEKLDDFVDEMMCSTDPPPYKLRALTSGLDVDNTTNDVPPSSLRNMVTIQIATAYNLRSRIPPGGCTIDIIVRYRGACTSKTEVWRKRIITIHIKYTDGPKVSSIVFRPDLIPNNLCFANEINDQWAESIEVSAKEETLVTDTTKQTINDMHATMNSVGQLPCVSVCGSKSVIILTVTNESRSILNVSRKDDTDESLNQMEQMKYLKEITINPGVSVKIPMIISRIPRFDENGVPIDVVSQFIHRTTLVWKYIASRDAIKQDGNLLDKATIQSQGYIRIPPSCFNDIVHRFPALLYQISVPPITMELYVNKNIVSIDNNFTSESSTLSIAIGQPITLSMNVLFASWIPYTILSDTNITMEFRCHRNDAITDLKHQRDYVWIGKLERTKDVFDRTVAANSDTKDEQHEQQQQQQPIQHMHDTKVLFCSMGIYSISALVRIRTKKPNKSTTSTTTNVQQQQHSLQSIDNVVEEIWWSPSCQTVHVV